MIFHGASDSASRALQTEGLSLLATQWGEPFQAMGKTLIGNIEGINFSNQLGEGGFIPSSNGVLFVAKAEFAKIGPEPWEGLRVVVRGWEFNVDNHEDLDNRWALHLTVSHPRTKSGVPEFTPVLSGAAGEFVTGATNNPLVPTSTP